MEPQPKLDPLTEAALRSLKDIAVPPPVSWFPQTWGWLALAILIALVLATWLVFALRRYRRNAYRREALALLAGIDTGVRSGVALQDAAYQLGELLKRTALAAWPRESVAALSGRAWIVFLSRRDDETDRRALARLLDDLEYQDRKPTIEFLNEVIPAARTWIERHNVHS
jgi:hypothetical protein